MRTSEPPAARPLPGIPVSRSPAPRALPENHQQTLQELRRRIRACEQGLPADATPVLSTGAPALDALFPAGGVRPGSLVEWLESGPASGAALLSLVAARQLHSESRRSPRIILIDTRRELFPLSLERLGFALEQLVLVRPATERDALWACEEALRCEGVGLVWAQFERLTSTSFRRLQLAAEESQGIGFLVRPPQARSQPSWAEARLVVQPRPSGEASPRFQIDVASSHGRPRQSSVTLQLDALRGTPHEISPDVLPTTFLPSPSHNLHPAHSLPLVSRLADSTPRLRQAGA
jgi:protein ImuA